MIVDTHRLRPAAAPARLQLGLYDRRSGRRRPITARGLPGPADTVELSLSDPDDDPGP